MAGSVSQSYTKYGRLKGNPRSIVVSMSWIGDSGNGTVPATAFSAAIMAMIKGFYLALVITDPGSPAPTDNYGITVTENGVDVLGGAGANRDTSNTEQTTPMQGSTPISRLITADLTFNLSGQSVQSAQGVAKFVFNQES